MGREQDFSISRSREGDAVVIAPAGEVDLVTVHEVRSALAEAASEARRVVIDLREVTFMDSSGLRLLVEAQRQSEQDGYALAVVRGPAALDRLFDVTGLGDRLELHDDPERAADGGQTGG
jgi:anti-sigma B factor antagonist